MSCQRSLLHGAMCTSRAPRVKMRIALALVGCLYCRRLRAEPVEDRCVEDEGCGDAQSFLRLNQSTASLAMKKKADDDDGGAGGEDGGLLGNAHVEKAYKSWNRHSWRPLFGDREEELDSYELHKSKTYGSMRQAADIICMAIGASSIGLSIYSAYWGLIGMIMDIGGIIFNMVIEGSPKSKAIEEKGLGPGVKGHR
eukprot:gnl/TRDRNA2_/TRDRNA2_146876_c0_seq1.p1 gnl/TRDRNA2_/TRDRNA2_146876_c0~~gnl/TRDRNA2_/TRDRNA2_146876_c0_seq1.p1  ORF type:complete len:197 (+),score=25.08 gnl/TRDRNA2_/TRDRNA2_146876_c0_seq1:80-670(+)